MTFDEKLTVLALGVRMMIWNKYKDNEYKIHKVKYGHNHRKYTLILEGHKPKKRTLIYFIHGGGWMSGNPFSFKAIAKFFAKKGYTVVLPAYRLAPKYKYPCQIEDVFLGFQDFLEKYWHMSDCDDVIVIGFSAGSELGANLVFNKKLQERYEIDPSIFKAFFAISGVLDFSKFTSKRAQKYLNGYLGGTKYEGKVNPLNLVTEKPKFPVFCLHGDLDELVPKECAYNFVERVRGFGGNADITLIKEKYHSNILNLWIGHGEEDTNIFFDLLKKCDNKN